MHQLDKCGFQRGRYRVIWFESEDLPQTKIPGLVSGANPSNRSSGHADLVRSHWLLRRHLLDRIAGDLLHDSIPVVRPDASLIEALERFRHHDGERLPVVNDSVTKRLIGTIAKTDVILALAGSTTRSATMVGSPAS